MSGIFGIVQRDGRPVDVGDMERMRDAMAHRGPDGSNVWISGSAGLGQLMLRTTPESLHESLPWQDPQSGLVITADARIDNREELISALRIDSAQATGLPDSQIILAAYLLWGESCVEHLLGDFVFAIWDERRRSLYIARDHMGVRPFYYYQSGAILAFASSARAVVTPEGVPTVFNDERIADFMVFQLEGVNNTCTFFRDVWRLPPAHYARFTGTGFTKERYWEPDAEAEIRLDSDEAYTEAFENVLTKAIEARLRCVGQPASMISGGIDSSTIACIGSKLLQERGVKLRTYSGISDDESDCRESQNIRRALSCADFESLLMRPSDVDEFASGLHRVAERIEDPFDAHCILLQMVYLSARRDGSVAVMDGLDGDGIASLTTNYPTYLLRTGHWIEANREIRGLWRNLYREQVPLWRNYVDAVKPLLAPTSVWRRRWEASFVEMARHAVKSSFFSQSLAENVDLEARFRAFFGHYHMGMAKTLRHNQVNRIVAPFMTAAIERYGRLAACCGVEQRHPLLDKRVVEFCVALPRRQKVHNGWSKCALRRVASRHLPEPIAWRKGWDGISGKFNDSWQTLNRSRNDKFLVGLVSESCGYIDFDRLIKAREQRFRSNELGEKERIVLYLAQWLGLPHVQHPN